MNVSLCLFLPSDVVFWRQREWRVAGGVLSNSLVCDLLLLHVLCVVVNGGGNVVSTPVCLLHRPDVVSSGAECLLMIAARSMAASAFRCSALASVLVPMSIRC